MLESLNPEQIALMDVVRQEYIDLCDRGTHGHDHGKARAAALWLYQQAGKQEPRIIVYDSPRSALLALIAIVQGAAVGASVWDSVRASVWDSIGASVGASVWAFWCSGCWDYSWCAFYNYFTRQGIVIHPKFDEYDRIVARSGMWSALACESLCIVAMMPTAVCRDDQHRLHSATGCAVTFGDGYGQHYIHGVFFVPELYRSIIDMSIGVPGILRLQNVEQRMAALKHVGAEYILQQCDARLVDSSDRGNRLYHIPDLGGMAVHLVRFTCPSTGREYVHFVDPAWIQSERKADSAVAEMFNWTLAQYDNLVWES